MSKNIVWSCIFIFFGALGVTVVFDLLGSGEILWLRNSLYALFFAVFTGLSFGIRALIRKMDQKYEDQYKEKKRKKGTL